jgi:hypothetical protein
MELAEALSAACSAEAALEDGTILIEHMIVNEDDPDGSQLYWYDARQGAARQHSDWFGRYYTLRDLADELAEYDIVVDRLDWSPTSRTVEVSDCTCADCKAFCLSHHLLVSHWPWYERAWYWLCWRLSDIAHWCQGCWWLVRYRWRSGCLEARRRWVCRWPWVRKHVGLSVEQVSPLSEFDVPDGWDDPFDEEY